MTMTAEEARKVTQSNIDERDAKMFGKLDSLIDQAIYEGKFEITTPILNKSLADSVIIHYSDLGYEITNFNNNMYGIEW